MSKTTPPPTPKKTETTASHEPEAHEQAKTDSAADTQADFNRMAREAQGAGLENVRPQDMQTPYIQIVQSNSPELKREHAKYVKGAKPADLLNTVTRKAYDVSEPDGKPLIVIPCGFVFKYIAWGLRGAGGGFKNAFPETWDFEHLTKQVEIEGKTIDVLIENPTFQIVPTAIHSVIVIEADGSRYPALISFTSTQLKKSKNWCSRMKNRKIVDENGSFQPPSFAFQYAITVVPESNNKGNWYGWKIEEVSQVTKEQWTEAYAFNKALASGPALPPPPSNDEEEHTTDRPY